MVQGQVTFNRVPEKVSQKVPEKVWEASVQSQVTLNRVPEEAAERIWESPVIFCVQYPMVPANDPVQDTVSIDIHRPMLTCMVQAAKESCEARCLRFQSGGYRISVGSGAWESPGRV